MHHALQPTFRANINRLPTEYVHYLVLVATPNFVLYTPQAQLVGMRTDILELESSKATIEKELHTLLLQLHASQLEQHQLRGIEINSDEIKKKLVSPRLQTRGNVFFLYCFFFLIIILLSVFPKNLDFFKLSEGNGALRYLFKILSITKHFLRLYKSIVLCYYTTLIAAQGPFFILMSTKIQPFQVFIPPTTVGQTICLVVVGL